MPGKTIKLENEFKLAKALDEIYVLLRRTNKYIDDTMPWALAKDETKKDRLATVLYNLVVSYQILSYRIRTIYPWYI